MHMKISSVKWRPFCPWGDLLNFSDAPLHKGHLWYVSLQDAIANNSFIDTDFPLKLVRGDVTSGFDTCDHVIEGEVHIGGQEHFYLETQASLVIPRDQGELEIHCSSQSPSEAQVHILQQLRLFCQQCTQYIPRNLQMVRVLLWFCTGCFIARTYGVVVFDNEPL